MSEQEAASASVQTNGLSVLSSLKERRQQVIEEQVLTLPVPRWTDPVIVVKYKPLPHEMIRASQTRLEAAPKAKRAALEVDLNADLLIKGCRAVVAVLDDTEYSLRSGDPSGEPTVFDSELAENLGLDDNARARDVVRALFITEPDIISAAQSLIVWSGYKETEADDSLRGE